MALISLDNDFSNTCLKHKIYYISYIRYILDLNHYDIFCAELKQVVKLFKFRYRTNKHFTNKINYNYEEIKQKNKKLNQDFKRVYKLISKNIGYNLLSN